MRSPRSLRSGCTRGRWSGPWPALKIPKVEAGNDIDDTTGDGSDVVDGYERPGPGRWAAMSTAGGWGWRCGSSAGSPHGCGCGRRPCRRSHRPRPAGPGRPSPGAWTASWSDCWRRGTSLVSCLTQELVRPARTLRRRRVSHLQPRRKISDRLGTDLGTKLRETAPDQRDHAQSVGRLDPSDQRLCDNASRPKRPAVSS